MPPAAKVPAAAPVAKEAPPVAAPAAAVAEKATAPPAASVAKSSEKVDRTKMSVAEKIAWCRAHDAK
jgi:hypothetical protein